MEEQQVLSVGEQKFPRLSLGLELLNETEISCFATMEGDLLLRHSVHDAAQSTAAPLHRCVLAGEQIGIHLDRASLPTLALRYVEFLDAFAHSNGGPQRGLVPDILIGTVSAYSCLHLMGQKRSWFDYFADNPSYDGDLYKMAPLWNGELLVGNVSRFQVNRLAFMCELIKTVIDTVKENVFPNGKPSISFDVPYRRGVLADRHGAPVYPHVLSFERIVDLILFGLNNAVSPRLFSLAAERLTGAYETLSLATISFNRDAGRTLRNLVLWDEEGKHIFSANRPKSTATLLALAPIEPGLTDVINVEIPGSATFKDSFLTE